ncbi:23277_t:CDS:2 [Dentiscutata erythropus]|uniref:23277_t:CDS:1 n=1 Tax=Dentiscutata erythropus TaxID=1348616 RepID=A0A9N9FPP5_9GLOM|nr:23277_t:CDS:2 [Dentiscutata erythropus]
MNTYKHSIKFIGKTLINKKLSERKTGKYAAQEAGKKMDKSLSPSELNDKEPWFYFSLFVPTPSGSLTILCCVAYAILVERIKKDVQEENTQPNVSTNPNNSLSYGCSKLPDLGNIIIVWV